jgi:hypothetical protein
MVPRFEHARLLRARGERSQIHDQDVLRAGFGSEMMIQRWISPALNKNVVPASMLDYLPNSRSNAAKL